MTLPDAPLGLFRTFLTAAVLACLPVTGVAETATLTSPSGFTITGRVLSFDGEFYRLDTDEGALTVAATGMTCQGAGCPGPVTEAIRLSAADPSLKRLLLGLFREFAAVEGWDVVETHDRAGVAALTMAAESGRAHAAVVFAEAPDAWRALRDPTRLPPAGWRDVPLALDGLVPAVAVENPVTGLTLLAVRAALAGEFPDWVGLGGGTDQVAVHWPSGLNGPLLDRYALEPGNSATRHSDFADTADAVARTPGGLALLPLSEIGSAVPLVLTGPCGRGAIGVPAAIRTGDYPLSEAVLLRLPAQRHGPVARSFLRWLDSPRARAAIRREGFSDLGVGPIADGRDGRQEADPLALASTGAGPIESLAADLGGASRLDVAVRFRDGSSLPDRTASIQIDRLTRAIMAGQFDGARLVFAGFSDANGAAAVNLRLSRQRAEAIRAAVIAAAGPAAERLTLEARGFGEASPVACNGVDWGERLNRRVEVWLARDDG
ncbi:MAG: OmpA family protein [Paracoccaceae bacterium]|nr:OmpA family protein [Paracoccaceae bacterium]